jgi:hypothetical protein
LRSFVFFTVAPPENDTFDSKSHATIFSASLCSSSLTMVAETSTFPIALTASSAKRIENPDTDFPSSLLIGSS